MTTATHEASIEQRRERRPHFDGRAHISGFITHTIERGEGELTLAIGYDFHRDENRVEVTSARLTEMPLGWPGRNEWKAWDYLGDVEENEAVKVACAEHAHDSMRHPGLIDDIITERLLRDIAATPDESEMGETTRLSCDREAAEYDAANVPERFEQL